MENNLIEKYERKRWKIKLWLTVGFIMLSAMLLPMLVVGYEVYEFPELPLLKGFMKLFLGFLVVSLFVLLFYSVWIDSRIKNNEELNEALNMELYSESLFKSYKNGFVGMIFACMSLLVITKQETIPSDAIIFVIMMASFITYQISWLVYNRLDR